MRNRAFTRAGQNVSGGWTKSAGKISTDTFEISNNVITPYYESSGNTFMGPCGNSIYVWFKGRGGSAVDICGMIDGNVVDLCRNYFKIVTKGISDESYNILDISDISVVHIAQNDVGSGQPNRAVNGIRIDLSRNKNADISNVTNPYTFSQHDEVYVWWDS